VIETFKSKDLERLWVTGKTRGINPNLVRKVRRLLDSLDDTEEIDELGTGTGLHPLTGNRQGQWAMTVSRNWRITFYFEDGNAFDVNFEDYHGK
jgi:proteic killer suppression protein